MIEYPKTKNLHKRDGARMLEDQLQLPEAASVQWWQAHEKIDGTNCRLDFRRHPNLEMTLLVEVGGRTGNAQLHPKLVTLLSGTASDAYDAMLAKIIEHDIESITVFAEGIGPKIQGNLYHLTLHELVAFDVLVNDKVFLPQDAVDEYAELLGIKRAPVLHNGLRFSALFWHEKAAEGFQSTLNPETKAEGLILRPKTELRTQSGERVQIKLKHKDYAER